MSKRKGYRITSNYCVLSKKSLEDMTREEIIESLRKNEGLKNALIKLALEGSAKK